MSYIFVTLSCVALLFVAMGSSIDLYYGTKNPYQPAGNLKAILTPTGCTAVHLNMVIRHGSRYPSAISKKRMFALLKKMNKLHRSSPYKYKNLTLPWNGLPKEYYIADSMEMSDAGSQEMYEIAQRFRLKFPLLFNRKYWNKYYQFISSDKQRTVRSAAAFGYGLFEGNGTLGQGKYQPIAIIFSGPISKDKVLRYHKTCPRYKKKIVDGNGLEELRKFGVSDPMKNVIMNIEERLKLKGKIKLSARDAQRLFWLCAFATMNHDNRDWCSIFTKEDLDVLEYYDDINQYYRHSYGNEISYKANCPLVADIIDSLKALVNKNQSYPYGIFRFTHSGTITALQSILGMYNDSVPLKANNFQHNSSRMFRTSKIGPMSANMAFVLHKCDRPPNYMVQILMNERPAVLPCCNNGSLCSFDKFLSCYEAIGKNCRFRAMCKIPRKL